MKIEIVTDTGADFLEEEAKLHGVTVVKLPVSFDGELETAPSGKLFWERLIAGGVARTSQPSVTSIEELFLSAKERGVTLVYICLSAGLSATYESLLNVKERIGYENIYIIDSVNASASQKIVVLEACRLRDEGKSAEEIVEYIENFKSKVHLFACIDNLIYLARGGRLNAHVAGIGNMIHLKPVISFIGGKVEVVGKTLGNMLASRALMDKVKAYDIDFNYPLRPIYSYEPKALDPLKKRFKFNGDAKFAEDSDIGATIGAHIGPYAFGLVFVTK